MHAVSLSTPVVMRCVRTRVGRALAHATRVLLPVVHECGSRVPCMCSHHSVLHSTGDMCTLSLACQLQCSHGQPTAAGLPWYDVLCMVSPVMGVARLLLECIPCTIYCA